MVILSLVVGSIAILMLYNTSLEQNRARLIETAKSRARLIESVARYDAAYNQDYPGGPEAATISQVIEAHGNFEGFGQTGEFTLARLEGDNIVFLVRHRHSDLTYPEPVPLESNLAEPMRQALAGLSGSLIGLDYRGETVLAAFEPVAVLNLGIVAKIDMAEIRAPFVRAGGIVIGVAIALIALGIFLFLRVSSPIVKRRKEYTEGLEAEITERKRVEEEVKSSHDDLRRIIDSMWDAVFSVKMPERIIEWANDSFRLTGYEPEECVGKTTQFLYPDEKEFSNLGDKLKSAIAEGKDVLDTELLLKRKNGEVFSAEITITFFKEKGDIVRIVGIIRDITERKKIDQIKDEFVGMVSHELKTPLTVIIGALDVVTKEELSDQQARELLQDAIGSADDMANIVENLLELSRSQADRMVLHLEPIDVVKIVWNVTQGLQSKSATHRLIVDSSSGPAVALADAVKVERILYNLIENAIKYSPKGGNVRVSAHRQDNQVVIEVSDQGIGISRKDQSRLFQSFERIDAYKTNSIAGIGLGLRVCRHLVEALGGRIWVESEPEKGSTFLFTLPAVDSDNQIGS